MAIRFNVRIERTKVESAFVEVSADNEDEAADKASKLAEDKPGRFDWELDSEDFEATDTEELFDEDSDDDTVEDEEDDEDE